MDPINIGSNFSAGPIRWPHEVNPKPPSKERIFLPGDQVDISGAPSSVSLPLPKKDILPGADILAKLPAPKVLEEAPAARLPEAIDGWNIAGVGSVAPLSSVGGTPLSKGLTFQDTGINSLESIVNSGKIFYMGGDVAAM
jgi:hypothetical protein